MFTLKDRAHRGLMLMLKKGMFDGDKKIDLAQFDMSDCTLCMMGQLTGAEIYVDFHKDTKALRERTEDNLDGLNQSQWNAWYGFDISYDTGDDDKEFIELTNAWRGLLLERGDLHV